MAHDSHDHAHGQHIVLQYQLRCRCREASYACGCSSLTEIMFFAGLIGTYIVLRFGGAPGLWPAPHDVIWRMDRRA